MTFQEKMRDSLRNIPKDDTVRLIKTLQLAVQSRKFTFTEQVDPTIQALLAIEEGEWKSSGEECLEKIQQAGGDLEHLLMMQEQILKAGDQQAFKKAIQARTEATNKAMTASIPLFEEDAEGRLTKTQGSPMLRELIALAQDTQWLGWDKGEINRPKEITAPGMKYAKILHQQERAILTYKLSSLKQEGEMILKHIFQDHALSDAATRIRSHLEEGKSAILPAQEFQFEVFREAYLQYTGPILAVAYASEMRFPPSQDFNISKLWFIMTLPPDQVKSMTAGVEKNLAIPEDHPAYMIQKALKPTSDRNDDRAREKNRKKDRDRDRDRDRRDRRNKRNKRRSRSESSESSASSKGSKEHKWEYFAGCFRCGSEDHLKAKCNASEAEHKAWMEKTQNRGFPRILKKTGKQGQGKGNKR